MKNCKREIFCHTQSSKIHIQKLRQFLVCYSQDIALSTVMQALNLLVELVDLCRNAVKVQGIESRRQQYQ